MLIHRYLLLGGAPLMAVHGASVARMVDAIIGATNDSETLAALNVIDTILQVGMLAC